MKFTIKHILSFLFVFFCIQVLSAQTLNRYYLSYIDNYHQIAVKQQKKHGIPASITLAQGLLESSAGQSQMARESNNHFGIKCHDWTGEKIYHDDDQLQECFRKYKHVEESYEDHSTFLTSRPRYQSLFNLKPTDYSSWALGLKAAGYATDPAYGYKLISLIETYNLHRYDTEKNEIVAEIKEVVSPAKPVTTRPIYKSNFLKFIVSSDTDSYASLADELKIPEIKLRKFNDADEYEALTKNSIVYLSAKRSKAIWGYDAHVVEAGETMYSIAQCYGIKLIALYKLNKMDFAAGAQVGQIIRLR